MSKGKLLAIATVWLVLFGIGAVAWRYFIQPNVDAVEEKKERARLQVGSSDSRYDHRLNLALDSFSGYAVLRSEAFRKELGKKSIKVSLHDDGADYAQRLQRLKSGETHLAAFTVDALIKASSQLNDLPASIVAIIDETRGADAIVGFKSKFQSVDDFNNQNVRFVLTPDSPSETLVRVVMAHFDLPNLSQNPIVAAKDAGDVFKQYQQASSDTNQVFVLWEPYVSRMTEDDRMHTIISTRDLFGYIVDVLVVNRDYLGKHPAVVRDVVESYFRAAYQHRRDMVELVTQDAKDQGAKLTKPQAESLVHGIQWKDTQRNYAHFGVTRNDAVQHIEDMIDNITRVLLETDAISKDPTDQHPNRLYFKDLLAELNDAQFHPGTDDGNAASIQLRTLSDTEWENLTPVGTLRVPKLLFARGTAKLLGRSRATLDELAKTLKTSQYYVLIRGNATNKGDRQLNKKLAADRADSAAKYLIELGIGQERIRAVGAEPSEAPSVTFMLGQLPY